MCFYEVLDVMLLDYSELLRPRQSLEVLEPPKWNQWTAGGEHEEVSLLGVCHTLEDLPEPYDYIVLSGVVHVFSISLEVVN